MMWNVLDIYNSHANVRYTFKDGTLQRFSTQQLHTVGIEPDLHIFMTFQNTKSNIHIPSAKLWVELYV